jgi:hypothetical protein
VVTATLTSGATPLLTQPQFSVTTLPVTPAPAGPTQATAPALLLVSAPVAQPVWAVGGEDPVTDNTEGRTGGTVAPAGPSVVPPVGPVGPGAGILSPGLGQGVRMGVEGVIDNRPMIPEESEEAEDPGAVDWTAGPTSALAGLALALSGYWGLPREEYAEEWRARARPEVWPKG